ncbi:discoidin domain-containing protein [Niabella hibiscisoli]|nr:discoidin domain-containing protein [Niabella hibiscisoli]
MVDDYNEYFLNQLFELLTEYGPIDEVWFDGAHPKTKGGQQYNYTAWKELIHKLAPGAVIFGREDVRWCGNESGSTRATEWNVISYMENPDTAAHFPDMTAEDIGSRSQLYGARFLHYQQAETNTSIREGWFYRDDTHQKVRSADDVFDIYERSVGGNSTFLLNIPPNRDGKFSVEDVKVLKEVGKRINDTYGANLFEKSDLKTQLRDDNLNTFLTSDNKDIIITLPKAVTINRLLIQEPIHQLSERIEKHAIDAWMDNSWKEIAAASNVGYKRILRFPEVTSSKFRIRWLQSRLKPAIATIGAYLYKTRPPQLQVFRNSDGKVVIQPVVSEFNWKPHGENTSKNLNKGMQIFYTTNGGEPTTKSQIYSTPFEWSKGTIKAIAVINQEQGPIVSETISLSKLNWKIIGTDSESQSNSARFSIDGNKQTWWESKPSPEKHFLAIDLGKKYNINAFAYTPQTRYRRGMLAKGIIEVSDDSVSWQKAGDFEFGNLINDPSTRKHFFNRPVIARYIRIKAIQTGSEDQLAIAELDFLKIKRNNFKSGSYTKS